MQTKRIVWGAALVAAVAAAGCAGGEAKEAEQPTTPTAVLSAQDVATVAEESLGTGVVLTGTLNPADQVDIRAQVSGLVTGLKVDRGVAVEAGQVLASIEAEGIRSQAAGAQAAVAAAESNLAVARKQYESAKMLHGAGAMSDIEFRTAESGYKAAQAQLAAANAQASAASEEARHTVITSPITGRISDRKVSGGEAVRPGDALFTVVSTDELELAGQVPVEQATHVQPGLPVEFTIDAYPGRTFRGRVARVEPMADPATRQVGVYVRLPNASHEVVGGVFATGRILTGGTEPAMVVPAAAVRGAGADSYVWVIADGVVAKRAVTIGTRDDSRGVVQITAGLKAGERIIAAPGEITEGTRVRIAAAPEGK